MLDKLEAALDNDKLIEVWEANLAEPVAESENQYKGVYFQGYLTEIERTASAEDMVEVSLTFGINGAGVHGLNDTPFLPHHSTENRIKGVTLPTVREVIVANSLFEQCLFEESICHNNQASLAQSVANCEHRAIGSGGGFGYRSIKDQVDVTLVESVALAFWVCHEDKARRKQKITFC